MTRIIMHGCNGKMGQVITGICKEDENVCIVAGIDVVDNRDNGYPVFTDIDACDVEADVIIDFAAAAAIDKLLDYAKAKKIPVVLCTTGLSPNQINKVAETSKDVAILKSANMSLGINTIMKLLKEAANVFAPAGFDI
ncbi:MAG: 4-hydroxy-tetrahydrodipicolinate reductase, partial [Lachnospiraceae bacterium]|nr:4-hydroxy-tetrahydrodipicolinate reductase [Lachnospiraceae bacterium]